MEGNEIMKYEKERKQLVSYAKLMFDRKLTNTAGGNISIRVGENEFLMTPTLMSQRFHCELKPNQILLLDQNENVIEGDGKVTREVNMHMACYQENPDIKCVLHAHAPKSLFFAVNLDEMPNLTEASQKLGRIIRLAYAPSTTPELAETVRKQIKEDMSIPKAYLLSHHGVLITNSNLEKAFDMLERLEWNAEIAYKHMVFQKLGIPMKSEM